MKRVVHDETTRRSSEGTMCTLEEGRTRQEAADGCDINRIVSRMAQGIVPGVNDRPAQYLDLTQAPGSLHEALEQVRAADAAFGSLPAVVRSAFGNEVGKFLQAFESEEGLAWLRDLKVVAPTEEQLADRREAAAEARAEKRREVREKAKRLDAAMKPPV